MRIPGHRLVKAGLPLATLIVLILAAPLLPLPGPNALNLPNRLKPPVGFGGTWANILGTDLLGRDIFSRLLAGGRLTALIAISSVGIGGVIGTTVGLVAGFRGGMIDTVFMRLIDAQLSIPGILLAMAIASTHQPSLGTLIFVLAVIAWAPYARVVRSNVLSLRERSFIFALTGLGLTEARILLRHIFPNVLSTFLVMATIEMAVIVLAESALSFVGIGVLAPDVSWGLMLSEGRNFMKTAWWVVVFPGLAITFTVLSVTVFGEALRAHFDPRATPR
jgi:peptide/nickel transport system permease protein